MVPGFRFQVPCFRMCWPVASSVFHPKYPIFKDTAVASPTLNLKPDPKYSHRRSIRLICCEMDHVIYSWTIVFTTTIQDCFFTSYFYF